MVLHQCLTLSGVSQVSPAMNAVKKPVAAETEYKFQYHTEIQEIINEEAESYFAGQTAVNQ